MLNLTAREKYEIWAEAISDCPPVRPADDSEIHFMLPTKLGTGHHRALRLAPGIELNVFEATYRDLCLRNPENQHLVQFEVLLSGAIDSGDFLYQDRQHGYVGGSGIQPAFMSFYAQSQTIRGINIHIEPQVFRQLFMGTTDGELGLEAELLEALTQTQGPQHIFTPLITQEMQRVVRQIVNCSLTGVAKQFYLQGKAFELIGLQLDSIQQLQPPSYGAALKPETVHQIQRAAEILRSHLENPPTQKDLAQQIGISDRTLQKGFKALFGMTPFVYLTQQRMVKAERLLRQPDHTVAEVANWVGYTNPAQFAAAFKRQFGITPSACKQGHKMVS
ncbi:MAG: AraC family transcriptional regulator [Cyanobacteria bacterium P01_B01_bin.77]